MLVFRDGRTAVSGARLFEELLASLRQVSSQTAPSVIDALLHAGQLECALADAGDPAAKAVAAVTDEAATALVSGHARLGECRISSLRVPPTLTISRPEGFAYYALHPLDFSELADSLTVPGNCLAVIGIRTIGTTLSAVVAARARKRGFLAERITVRPTGHPWDRKLELLDCERSWIAENLRRQAAFWIVDEGPGLSGSSFLSVGEALVKAGTPREQITFLGSAPPSIQSLRAHDAAARWTRFRSCFTDGQSRIPPGAEASLGGGQWREFFVPGRADWPATWPQYERAKFLSCDRRSVFKFEGLGSYGAEVRERARMIAEAGFGPEPVEEEDGYTRYALIEGAMIRAGIPGEAILAAIADYCAWRAKQLEAEPLVPEHLKHMVRTNASEGLRQEFDLPDLRIERPAIVDGKMQPYEWRLSRDGRLVKLDGASHGEDHFFPGPTDIAWDLAGVIVEWQLQPKATEFFLERYCRAAGDDPRDRLPAFLLAYVLFRLGYCAMAAESLRGTEEETRFRQVAERYRRTALAQLREELLTSGSRQSPRPRMLARQRSVPGT